MLPVRYSRRVKTVKSYGVKIYIRVVPRYVYPVQGLQISNLVASTTPC